MMTTLATILGDLNSLLATDDITPAMHRDAVAYARAHATVLARMDLRHAVDTCLDGHPRRWFRAPGGHCSQCGPMSSPGPEEGVVRVVRG